MTNTVLFDPGIGDLVVDFNEYINDVYSKLNALKTIHQKKANFKLYFPKIKKAIENNIAFYIGCLLWAYIIKEDNEEKDILGNVFLDMPEELIEEYDYLIQVNFISAYLKNLEKDYTFYTGQKLNIPQLWKEVISIYGEFLSLNKGFVKTKTTKDLILPEIISNHNFEEDIQEIIEKAISERNLNLLISNVNFPQNS